MLNEKEIRVLGCLVEKEKTTPEYYPLTLNALVNACNQKSNRSPIVAYDETTVRQVLDALQEKKLTFTVYGGTNRVAKYEHGFSRAYGLSPEETAVLCELMVRGPQTAGEIRTHAERMHKFAQLGEVAGVLDGLSRREQPLVVLLPRQAGMKESRYAHLLAGEPQPQEKQGVLTVEERVVELEKQAADLKSELDALKKEFISFKTQF
jgi:uncharacterized protein